MIIPWGAVIDLLNCVICAYCSYHLYRSWQRDQKQLVLLFFSRGYFCLIFSYLFFSLPLIFFPEQHTLLGIAFILAQGFLYMAVAYFAKVVSYFIRAQWAARVFWMVVAASIIAIILHIVYFSYPVYDKVAGLTIWNIHPVVGAVSTLITIGVLAPSAILFFWLGIRSLDKIVKVRSLIISIGLTSLIITAYTYYNAKHQPEAIISDILSLLSFLIIFIGVIYKRGSIYINKNN